LRRGEANSLLGIGGLEHIGDELAQLGIKLGDRFAGFESTGSGYLTIFRIICFC